MIRFDGQVAIVTGAGRGMGREHALLLARRGARVVVNDYGGASSTIDRGTIETAQAVVDAIRTEGGEAIANADMVGTGESAAAIVDAALAAFGRVDILVNNAGGTLIGDIDAFDDAQIEGVLRANFIGGYMLLRRVWPHMRAQGYGRIVNIMSSGVLGIGGTAPYAAGKAGLIGLTAEAAVEGKPHGILVNGVFPTGASRLTDRSQPVIADWYRSHFQPEKVAAAVAYLCSDALEATGEIFSVGAGRVSRMAIVNNDGAFDADITPESVAADIAQIRDMSAPVLVGSCWEDMQRFFAIAPWPGGEGGIL